MNLSRARTPWPAASCSRWGASRPPRWRCWPSASGPSRPSSRRTTSRSRPSSGPRPRASTRAPGSAANAPPPRRAGCPRPGREDARAVVERVRGARARAGARRVDVEVRDAPRAAAPALRPDRAAAPRQPAVRPVGPPGAARSLQGLYEKHKLLTYPRTDSRHLSRDVAATLPAVVEAVAGPYRGQLAPGTGERPLSRRFVDDAKVSDHHAIIPTGVSAEGLELSHDERRLYDLVCRRLLMAWHDEHVFAVTTVITRVESGAAADRFHSTGTAVQQVGWKALDPPAPRAAARAAARRRPTPARSRPCPRACAPASRAAWTESRRARSARARPGASATPRCSRPWRPPARLSTTASCPRP